MFCILYAQFITIVTIFFTQHKHLTIHRYPTTPFQEDNIYEISYKHIKNKQMFITWSSIKHSQMSLHFPVHWVRSGTLLLQIKPISLTSLHLGPEPLVLDEYFPFELIGRWQRYRGLQLMKIQPEMSQKHMVLNTPHPSRGAKQIGCNMLYNVLLHW